MAERIEAFLTEDHARLDALLGRADADPNAIDAAAFDAFRRGLLRHIAMEEKVLLPLARAAQGDQPLAIAKRLREDHGKIAKLLVPSPTHAGCAALRAVLAAHNALEEGAGALYATCDALAAGDVDTWLARLSAQPAVPPAPHYDGPAHTVRRRTAGGEP